jgi:biopolymer transport protein ExbD
MAGSQNAEDNPVAINVVPMVDVIFCLCVFFMCSFKFKQVQGRFETWLPQEPKGLGEMRPGDQVPEEFRVALFWDEAAQRSVRKYGTRVVEQDDQLQQIVRSAYADYAVLGKQQVPVTIDADSRVPWGDVIEVVNIAKREQVEKIEFAYGAVAAR